MKLEEFIEDHKSEFKKEIMSEKLDFIFEKLLKDKLHQPKKQKIAYIKYISVAASIVFIFSVGVWFLNQDISSPEQKELMASLGDASAGKRLEGVYKFNDEYEKEDNQIINRLIEIIHNDENANVKIATIDALLKFPSNEIIRKNLIKGLENENKPLVQIKLIKALDILRENRARKPLEDIINNEQTYPIVKNNSALAMVEIKQ
jgi:hypothetical protein